MIKMTKEQINERIAEIAGFEIVRESVCHGGMQEIVFHITDPDGNTVTGYERKLPDFFNSIDAQAKWVWTKVDNVVVVKYDTAMDSCSVTATKADGTWTEISSLDSPANASAIAIIEAVDGEKVEVV